MINQHNEAPTVLAWQADEAVQLRSLWDRVAALAWIPGDAARFVIQIGQRCRTQLAVATARSLAVFLHDRQPRAKVEIVDPDGRREWGSFALYDVAAAEPLGVAGLAATRGLRVPRLWFESFHLITVAAAHPDPAARVAAVLDAQADPLRRLRNAYSDDVLAYEAHRLAASDLSIACGTMSWTEPTAECWWAVSTSDIAADHAVALATGIAPMELPTLRRFARHELIPPDVTLQSTLPSLDGYATSMWRARTHAARERIIDARRALAYDFATGRRNVHKIPGYVRRQLASRRGGAA
ncbi:MAG TPA: hypothetical protein VMW17_20445 [Candidatus Binatia bacterium]|nr:hypothetical protein [Candidatus Binatia bacterium]